MTHQLKTIAIDDEPLALSLIKTYAAQNGKIHLEKCFEDAVTALQYLQNNEVDLLLIDINMPDINGLELVKSLQHRPIVIFTTAYRKFAADGFDLDAADYILKPISTERFNKAIEKAVDNYAIKTNKNAAEDGFFVRSDYRMLKIFYQDVIYIEGMEDYIKIHLHNAKPVLTLMPLKKVVEKLPADFLRIHRSYIIAAKSVVAASRKKVELKNKVTLPVSDTYVSNVLAHFKVID